VKATKPNKTQSQHLSKFNLKGTKSRTNHFWEANSFSAGRTIPRLLWDQKFHHRFRKILVPNLRHSIPSYHSLRSTSQLPYHLCLVFPRDLYPSGYTNGIMYASLICSMSVTCSAQLILLTFTNKYNLVKSINYAAFSRQCPLAFCYILSLSCLTIK
jgi:hypothetical protein